jgi:hypothetical protein
VVVGVDEDGVVRAGGDARLAADADRLSKSTMPSGRLYIAAVGQAGTHGASAHWLQRVTWNGAPRLRERAPTSTYLTYVR